MSPQNQPAKGITYAESGVSIAAADETLAAMKSAVQRTHNASVLKTLADFGGLFALGTGYHDPVLVAGTDGVGTKLKIAFEMDKHDTIGQDLVAMCVDDIVVQGAKPLFFLDYLATGKLQPETAATVVRGIAAACEQVGCALIGGETAELPGFYAEGEYDLAGFAVGVVERERMIDGSQVRAGDVILGLPASGLHSNGYSLARKVLLEQAALPLDLHIESLGRTVGEELLKPTRLYAGDLVAMLEAGLLPHGMAHVTGGGWPDNINRMVPPGLCAVCAKASVPVPPICALISELGPVTEDEMYHTFNMGVGMTLAVEAAQAEAFTSFFAARGMPVFVLGQVEAGETKFRYA